MTTRTFPRALALLGVAALGLGAAPPAEYDVVVRGGTLYDGSGAPGIPGDLAIRGDRIVAMGRVPGRGVREVDARGLAVAPGFINMLSWAGESMFADGRAQSDIRQGVTLEVMGEGWSGGPVTDAGAKREQARQGDIRYPITWRSFGGWLDALAARGVSPNVSSFVGAATVRVHELGEGDVDPSPAQLSAMRALVARAMDEGAMGVGSSLIYAPGTYAETPELTALADAAARCGGMYVSHIRSEADALVESVDELIAIARSARTRAEIYHLKASARENWPKLATVIARVEEARRAGLAVTANMYSYPAASTGLDASMPTWVQAGGEEQWFARLADPATRARVAAEMVKPATGWENNFLGAGPEGILLVGFKNPALKPLTGKTLAEVARMRRLPPEQVAIDLVVEDRSRVDAIYFLMDEADVARLVALPWMSFGSDASARGPYGVFLKSSTHPRAYGNFARVLGKYVREERRATLPDAIRRMTSLPAANLRLADRGALKVGHMADVAVFDPRTIADRATFAKPQQYAVGMRHVFVNGVAVLRDGEHTGATPGRVVRGPGYKRCATPA